MAKTESSHARLVRLRQEVEALTRDRVSPAMSGLAARAESTVGTTAVAVRDQAIAVHLGRERPWLEAVRNQRAAAAGALAAEREFRACLPCRDLAKAE